MRAVAGKNTLYQQHLYSPKISMHIYKPKNSMSEICANSETGFQLTEYSYLCSAACFRSTEVKDLMPVDKREESGFNFKESSSRELKERVLV